MGLVYIEYISRLPGIDLETFRAQAAQGQEGWDSGYEDELVLSVGRTWRLGPDPGYMTVWHARNASLDRIDAWDRIFRSGEADDLEQPFFQVARIDVAGCYDPLLEPVPARNGTYYAEFFALPATPRIPSGASTRAGQNSILSSPSISSSRESGTGSRTRRPSRLDHPRLRSAGFRGNRAGRSQRPDQAFRRRDLCRLRQGDPVRGGRWQTFA